MTEMTVYSVWRWCYWVAATLPFIDFNKVLPSSSIGMFERYTLKRYIRIQDPDTHPHSRYHFSLLFIPAEFTIRIVGRWIVFRSIFS